MLPPPRPRPFVAITTTIDDEVSVLANSKKKMNMTMASTTSSVSFGLSTGRWDHGGTGPLLPGVSQAEFRKMLRQIKEEEEESSASYDDMGLLRYNDTERYTIANETIKM